MSTNFKYWVILSVIGIGAITTIWANKSVSDKNNLTMLNIEALSSEESGYAIVEIRSDTVWDDKNGVYVTIESCGCSGYGDLDCSNLNC